eukprot:s2206_g5.t1
MALALRTWTSRASLHHLGMRCCSGASRLPPCSPTSGMTADQRELYDRIIDDRGKTGAKGGFAVTNEDGSLVSRSIAAFPAPPSELFRCRSQDTQFEARVDQGHQRGKAPEGV